ncbi:hypothetical protein IFR04_011973 [Cadophora malorum]|uniref:Heterokaryon incompatibility domain-containing protein n=1 Tax=Cadophora malorum TaxID=108018 RepID=A0A8H7W4H8_9HELO|nr:hypothetical protein IFR04_011973 [Cadophora malorum]
MCDYYGNAYLTVSGTCSSRSCIPFLRVSKKHPYETFRFQLGGEVHVRRLGRDDDWQIPTKPRKNPNSPDPIHETKPILSRAWVFQENSLSNRVIHFTDEGVLFECKHSLKSASKVLTRGTQDLFSRIQSWNKIKDDWDRVLDADPYGRWRRSVASYFPLRLTCEDDRLPGLSGLAESKSRQIITLQKNKVKIGEGKAIHEPPLYLSGLWKASLAQDLCWHLAGEDGIVSSKYVAPSWSWAALQGEVIHFAVATKDFAPALEFKSNHIILEKSESIFGKVTQGSYIVVSAPMKAMDLIYTHFSLILPDKTLFLAPGIQGVNEDEFFVSIDVAATGTELLGRTEYTEMWETWKIDRLVQPVFCMLVGEALGKLHGLILEEVEVEEINQKRVAKKVEHRCFKRIGYFRTRRIMYAGKWGEPIKVEDQEKVQRCRDAFLAGGKVEVRLY